MSKIILITGSSTGIGASTAEHLSSGNQIIVHYNSSRSAAKNVAKIIESRQGLPHIIQADLTHQEGCEKVAAFINKRWGKLDVLVNNVGGLIQKHHASDISWSLIDKLFKLNTFSTLYLSSICIPLLQKGHKPCIVNLSTVSIRSGGTFKSVYTATKGAIDGFTRSLARELAPDIRVNAVAPGVIETPFHKNLMTDVQKQEVITRTPLKRLGEAQQVAKVIAMLIDNEFITGETIDVNGGLTMR
jgi:3-oxoacyl-[acyl-carrier protein] reductase